MLRGSIYTQAGLTAEEIATMDAYISGDEEFYGTDAFNKLFEYFFNHGLMPYGVAKARTECPDDWILDSLARIDDR